MRSIANASALVGGGGSTIPTAAQVSYDNTESGLTATNVQDAIDEVAQGLGEVGAWTFVGSETGTNPVTLPADYNEIYVKLDDGADINFTYVIAKASLTAGAVKYRNGYYLSSVATCAGFISASLTSVKAADLYINGTESISSAHIAVYYR